MNKINDIFTALTKTKRIPLFLVSFIIMFSLVITTGLCLPQQLSWAETSQDKQQEADKIYKQIDELQTKLNTANEQYSKSQQRYDEAQKNKEEYQIKIEESQKQLDELKNELGTRAKELYRIDATTSFIDIILGSSTLNEFLNSFNMMTFLAKSDAELITQTKEMKEKLQTVKDNYEKEEQIEQEEMEKIQTSKNDIEYKQNELKEQVDKITEEIAELRQKEAQEAAISGIAGPAANLSSGTLMRPVPGAITSPFGPRWGSYHKGCDFAASLGEPYYACADGTVLYSYNDGGWHGGMGNAIAIAHGNGLVSIYMHSSKTLVSAGEQVKRGQNIGLVGSTGDSTGPHLHLSVEYNGTRVNPANYF